MEQEQLNNDWVIIKNQEAADTLIDPKKYKYFVPFMVKPRSLTEAAASINVKTNLMHYHVRQLLALDLIKEIDERGGRGRKGMRYQASSSRFFIPLKYTSVSNMETVLYGLQEPMFRQIVRSRIRIAAQEHDDLGMAFELTPENHYNIFVSPQSDEERKLETNQKSDSYPALFSKYITLKLTHDDAKWLQREIIRLYEKLIDLDNDKGRDYVMGLSIAPMTE
ncbi:MAG: helix-turn-helix transcriptional regulator [Trueperaceae bacterium]|nr:helix-turn-helix transcriptional regulator [Trueperaceae bacterium]